MKSAGALIGVLVAMLAGCSQQAPGVPGGQATASTSLSPSPGSSPTPSACPGSIPGGADPSKAVLQAWLCSDDATLHAKLAAAPYGQLAAVPKDIDLKWTFIRCDGAMGSSYCNYRNTLGSELIFRSRNEPPQDITEVRFDKTTFYTDAEKYVREFIDAWEVGNAARMQALGSSSVVTFASTHTAPSSGYTVTPFDSPKVIFEVHSAAAKYVFELDNPLGKAGAITFVNTL